MMLWGRRSLGSWRPKLYSQSAGSFKIFSRLGDAREGVEVEVEVEVEVADAPGLEVASAVTADDGDDDAEVEDTLALVATVTVLVASVCSVTVEKDRILDDAAL